ncbi:MAG: response regulator [Micromonosporaceae bacterium]|nr:response regulator [Micromonosporaceae bacterium]
MEDSRQKILVVDDDPDITGFVEMSLRVEGYDVAVAHDGLAALQMVRSYQPDLMILDVMMPELDGIEVLRRVRADPVTTALPVIVLTAKGQTPDKVIGLQAGADDYVVKPFDTLELVVRVQNTLRRNRESREVSPLSGLPGNHRILREIADRLRTGKPFAVCYCDIDGFKAVNDAYGFARGDEFIVTLGRKLLEAVATRSSAFLGHVGGDDFVVICDPEDIRPLTEQAVTEFEKAADALYDPEDRERGYITVKSRRDGVKDVGLVTVSIGVALSTRRPYTDPRQIIADATEMKSVAKSQPGSYVAVDRRSGE